MSRVVRGGTCIEFFPFSARPTWMVTMRGSGCRVFAPPSMAIPKVGALLDTRIRHDVGSRSPGCGERRQRCRGSPGTACLPRSLGHGPTAGRFTHGRLPWDRDSHSTGRCSLTPDTHDPSRVQVWKGLGRSGAALRLPAYTPQPCHRQKPSNLLLITDATFPSG